MPITTTENNEFALTNISVFDGSSTLQNQAVIICGDTIESVIPMNEITQLPKRQINCEGLLATAGFIDVQLNGCGGVLFNTDISKATLDTINKTNLAHGTTQYLPTLITSSANDMDEAIALIDSIPSIESEGILGLHLEGPFISYEKKGAHNADFIRVLDLEAAKALAKFSHIIKVVTLAPERTSQDALNCLIESGITVSMGHTNATYQQLVEKQGITMATHLYNAMTPLSSRETGAVGYIFEKQPAAGIIVDGIHASYASVRIAKNVLKEKLFLVTDAVTPAGTNMKMYDMAGTEAFVTQGKCHYKDGTIAGAALTMIDGVNNLIDHVGISKEEALRMASLYPAQALGINDSYGVIQSGYKANLTLLTTENKVHSVYQMGQQFIAD
ncbi:N-acetylglucosamine-6-phosphate deacetylase [Photobacterium minamisatsumaniensis]|uniref:N-acetylglucosamine-6-phosphate deacetylase n=1 Tax=Photobacterium minamisatsumaniensis TaxID=2910233 RepID=UPI003D119E6B